MMKKLRAVLAGVALSFVFAPSANAVSIFLAECVFQEACWTSGPTPWSANLDAGDLASLGLGTVQPFIAAQDAPFVIRLGVTTVTFTTPGGPVVVQVPEFSGGFHGTCDGLCEIDIVALIAIPGDATAAVFSGQFGNSFSSTSAGVNLCFGAGPGPCAEVAVPEPGSLALLAGALVVLGLRLRRRSA